MRALRISMAMKSKISIATRSVIGSMFIQVLLCSSPTTVEAIDDFEQVERVGSPTFYAPSIERYRYGSPDTNNSAYYPIPKSPVTRETYMHWIEEAECRVR